jgi:YidC/Oxa1 family membrane protein insertase
MEKRVTLAVILCIVFAVAWMFVSNLLFPAPKPSEVSSKTTAAAPTTPAEKPAPVPEKATPPPAEAPVATHEPVRADAEERTTIDTTLFRAVFSNAGASLCSLRLKRWTREAGLPPDDPNSWLELILETEPKRPSMVLLDPLGHDDLRAALWKAEPVESSGGTHRLSYAFTSGAGLSFRKTFELEEARSDVRLHVEITNPDDAMLAGKDRSFELIGPSGLYPEGADLRFPLAGVFGYRDPRAVTGFQVFSVADVAKANGTLSRKSGEDRLLWVALLNKYFAAILAPMETGKDEPVVSSLDAHRLSDAPIEGSPAPTSPIVQFDGGLSYLAKVPAVGKSLAFDAMLYAGPRDKNYLDTPDYERFAPVVDAAAGKFCFLDFIVLPLSKGLGFALRLLHTAVRNWGVAIILLTALVKLCLFPLTSKQVVAMQRQQALMAKFKPELDRLKEKYKNNKQKLSEETLKFYKEKKLNLFPLGGCLPLFVTMPVFMGLYYIFNSTIDLRQASFVAWIRDLSRPDQLIAFSQPLAILPCLTFSGLNLLPILMGALWFWQQKSQPKPADPQMAQQQQMMAIMPIMMTFALYNSAAGLSLYWITNSLLGVVEQKVIKAKFLPKPA